MKIKQHFNELSTHYDKEASWRLDPELIDVFFRAVPRVNGQIIELGCGTGIISKALKNKNIIGVDCSEKMCEIYERVNTKAICADIRNIPLSNNSTEMFLVRQVFQYFTLKELDEVIQEIERLRKKDHCIIVSHHFVAPDDTFSYDWLSILKKHIQPLRKGLHKANEISDIFISKDWENEHYRTSFHQRRINVYDYFVETTEYESYDMFCSWLSKSAQDKKNRICLSFDNNILTYSQEWALQKFIKNE